MAQAEGPSSVLGKVLAPLVANEEVVLARVWFLEDADCPVCEGTRAAEHLGVLHLRASGSGSSGSFEADTRGAAHSIRADGPSRIAAIAAHGEPVVAALTAPVDEWGLEATSAIATEVRGVLGYPLF